MGIGFGAVESLDCPVRKHRYLIFWCFCTAVSLTQQGRGAVDVYINVAESMTI